MSDSTKDAKEYLKQYNIEKDWGESDADIIETLAESEIIWEGNRDSHRWWDCIDRVIVIGSMYIMFTWAEANRDECVQDLGWDFDWSSLSFAEPEEIKTTIYKRKE